ncbi:MAG TPA: hypothetical protein VGX68_06600 [Thermoanaerobaculia bacterium]|nr:hypothetical protein [Thermoanaerobaculia bacterium]
MRHLLFARCPACLASLPPALTRMLGLPPARRRPAPEEEAAYEAVIERAAAKPLALARHLREQREAADQGLKLLAAGRKLPRAMEPLARMWALLDRSWQLRFEDPQRMVQLADHGVLASLQLDEAFYGQLVRCDLQARAHADLGNACRVANKFSDARRFLEDARRLFEQGTGDRLLEMRLLGFEAALFGDLRRFGLATQKLQQIHDFYKERGDDHLVGRTLVTLGLYTGYSGCFDLAVECLKQSLELIDAERDPASAYAASHNLVLFLIDSGRIAEAKKLRLVHSRHLLGSGGRVNEIKFRILEGRIAFGEGNYGRAEGVFREVVKDLDEIALPFLAGIERLDLAASLLAQGKAREAERTVTVAKRVFVSLGIQREALQAVILLRDSFRIQAATLAKVLEVADFLRRATSEPKLRFEARAWED